MIDCLHDAAKGTRDPFSRGAFRDVEPLGYFAKRQFFQHSQSQRFMTIRRELFKGQRQILPKIPELGQLRELISAFGIQVRPFQGQPLHRSSVGPAFPVISAQLAPGDGEKPSSGLSIRGPAKAAPAQKRLSERFGGKIEAGIGVARTPNEERKDISEMPVIEGTEGLGILDRLS